MDLDKLISATAKGDKHAYKTLYESMDKTVYTLALAILRDRVKAEDAMQDTFIKICTTAHTYKPGTNARAWMLTITRNTALNLLKSYSRETGVDESKTAELSSPDFSSSSVNSIYLNEVLRLLNINERQIVLLHLVSGLKFREVSNLLDLPLGTVLTTYHRCMKKLSNLVKSDFPNLLKE